MFGQLAILLRLHKTPGKAYQFMSTALRAKASVEHLLGVGLKREVLKRVA